ncbi:MAG: PIN domain-containing protein [Sandaracinaceae bacterium]|nr:PIN domain-containing protein [Sandaracinaceae bacterium]
MSLADRIPDGAAVVIDTNPIVYLLEANPLGDVFEPIFEHIDAGRIHAVVTPITVAEVLAGPIAAGDEALAARYLRALTASAGWSLREIDAEIAVLAARLRIRYRLKLPDAIQLAVALHEDCFALVTHDRDFASVSEPPILGA